MHRILPPLLDSPCEGELHLLLSGARLSPSLSAGLGLVVFGTWWGDSEAFSCRLCAPDGSAKAVFGVSCNGPSFRQYLLDAKTLVLTLHTHSIEDKEKDISSSKSDHQIPSTEGSEELLKSRSSTQQKILKPLNSSPSKRQLGSSPRRRISPTKSKSSVISAADLPEHLLGTPRHRLLEKQRTTWLPCEEVGQAAVSNLKLNSRGELVCQCNIVNMFGDERGTLDVTMIYYENIALLKASLNDSKVLPSSQTSEAEFRSEKEKYLNSENKENVNVLPYQLQSSSGLHKSPNVTSVADSNDFSHLKTNFSHPSCEGSIAPSGKISPGQLHPSTEKFGEDCDSNASFSDESILAYLRQLNPQSLVECGAIREDDLPKFLKLIQDCTLENYHLPLQRNSESMEPSYCTPRNFQANQSTGFNDCGNTDSNSRKPAVRELEDLESSVPLRSAEEDMEVYDANYPSENLLGLESNVNRKASCFENIHKNYTELIHLPDSLSDDHLCSNKTNSDTRNVGPGAFKGVFQDKAECISPPGRDVGLTAAVQVTDSADVVCSEPSVISLPSGVWPLDGSPAFSRPPFRDAGQETSSSNDGQRHDIKASHRTHEVPNKSCTSGRSELADACLDRQSNLAQFSLSQSKVLNDSLLTKLKYKAITPDGTEIVMDCQRLARLTRPSFHIQDSLALQSTSDFNRNAGEYSNYPRTSHSSSHVLHRKLWKNQKNNFHSSQQLDSQVALSSPHHHHGQSLFDSFPFEKPPSLRANGEDSDPESDTSAASNETYTTSTLNNPDDSPSQASPGSVLLVEVKELTLRGGAVAPDQLPARPGLRGVKNRSNVCILTSLTVSAPAPHAPSDTWQPSALGGEGPAHPPAPAPFHQRISPQRQVVAPQKQAPCLENFSSEEPVAYDKLVRSNSQTLPRAQTFSNERLLRDEQVLTQELESPLMHGLEPLRGGGTGSQGPADDLLPLDGGGVQTITLASRHLDKDKIHYGSVQAFGLSGLRDPEQLQKVTLLIRVFRRVLGRRKSEELCSAEVSLWDVYRLVHGHLVIPLSPTPSCSARATQHSSVGHLFRGTPSKLLPSRRSVESGIESERMTTSLNKNNSQGSCNDFSVKNQHSSRRSGRFTAGNVRSTAADRDFPRGGSLSVRGRGVKSLLGSKSSSVKNYDDTKPVSGEISIFLKLFLNEQYVNELRNSIVEDPSVMASFVQRRELCAMQGFEDSVEADVVTVMPNLNRSETTRLLDRVTRHRGDERSKLQPTKDLSPPSSSFERPRVAGSGPHDGRRSSSSEGTRKSAAIHLPTDVSLQNDENYFPEKHPAFRNKEHESYPSSEVVTTRVNDREFDCDEFKTLEVSTELLPSSVSQRVTLQSPTLQTSESSTKLTMESLKPKYESQTGRALESSSRAMPQPLMTLPRQCNREKDSNKQTSSTLQECVLSSSTDPSLSFIQTLSQQYHQNTEYFIRIQVEILEAKNLDSIPDGVGGVVPPSSFVRASFFGEDVRTAVCGATASPVWNCASQIVVSSFQVNDSSSNIVLRVHHSGPDGAPLLGCLALRPPTPFWPGQVSLCGWYPLLNVRGRLAGHIKLSLTIVESVLGAGNTSQTRPRTPAVAAACASPVPAPLCAPHAPRPPPPTDARVDDLRDDLFCTGHKSPSPCASSPTRNSSTVAPVVQLLEDGTRRRCGVQSAGGGGGCGGRGEVDSTNSESRSYGVSDRIQGTNTVHKNSIVNDRGRSGPAALHKHALSDRVPSDRALSDRIPSNRALSDLALSDRTLSDRALSDRALSDRALSDRALFEYEASDVMWGQVNPVDSKHERSRAENSREDASQVEHIGSHPYNPHRSNEPNYPHRSNDPNYPHRSNDPNYPHRSIDPNYPHRSNDPNYPHRSNDPNYPHRSNDPNYPHRSNEPNYPHRSNDPNYPHRSIDPNYPHPFNEQNDIHGETKTTVSENWQVSKANYMAIGNESNFSSRAYEHSIDNVVPRVSLPTPSCTESLPRRNISTLRTPSSDFGRFSSCAHESHGTTVNAVVEPSFPTPLCSVSVSSDTDNLLSAGPENNLHDTPDHMREGKIDHGSPESQYNVASRNEVLPVAPSVPSCLRTVDSPRGVSKKVKFAVEKRSSLTSVPGVCTSFDAPRNEIMVPNYEETLYGWESLSGAHERLLDHEQIPLRSDGERSSFHYQDSLVRLGREPGGVEQEASSSLREVERLSDRDPEFPATNECSENYYSKSQGSGYDTEHRYVEKLSANTSTIAPNEMREEIASKNRNISSLLESFSWMNIIKDHDSPCVSYIDPAKRQSCQSENFRYSTRYNEPEIVDPVKENDAAFKSMLKSPDSPHLDSGLTSEIGSMSQRSSDADSFRCVSMDPACRVRDSRLGAQKCAENQASVSSNPRPSGERKSYPKSRLAANFSFNKRPK